MGSLDPFYCCTRLPYRSKHIKTPTTCSNEPVIVTWVRPMSGFHTAIAKLDCGSFVSLDTEEADRRSPGEFDWLLIPNTGPRGHRNSYCGQ